MHLYSRIIGSGSPVIILHGLFGMSDNWVSIANRLASEDYCVHLLDLRNHGNSPHADSHRYPDMCEDLLDYLNDKGLGVTNIIGHSMGGKLGMVFGLLEPERIEKLIVVDMAPSSYQSSDDGYHRRIFEVLRQLDLSTFANRTAIKSALTEALEDNSLAQFLAKNIRRDKRSASFSWKLNIPVLEKFLHHIYIGLEELAIYAPSPVSTLFVKGSRSSYVLAEHEADRQYFFPDSQVIEIADTGHWVHSEQPDIFAEAVLGFLHGHVQHFDKTFTD